jgi:zinc transporter, ZIP family
MPYGILFTIFAMSNFWVMLALSAVIGFSIYLSLPVVLHKRAGEMTRAVINSAAIGILIFLIADVFADVNTFTNDEAYYGLDFVFIVSFAVAYLVLYGAENRSRERSVLTATQTALIIALGIGFQNLTEGLVFGASYASVGFVALSAVVFVGFLLQNITEGFPIASPFSGRDWHVGQIAGLFFIGGIPTLIGGAVGFFYASSLFDVIFDGVAIGAIVYVILPMIKSCFRSTGSAELDITKQRLTYLGMFIGFVVGFLVNII